LQVVKVHNDYQRVIGLKPRLIWGSGAKPFKPAVRFPQTLPMSNEPI
jgi:hypothetical protein